VAEVVNKLVCLGSIRRPNGRSHCATLFAGIVPGARNKLAGHESLIADFISISNALCKSCNVMFSEIFNYSYLYFIIWAAIRILPDVIVTLFYYLIEALTTS
jgi:hypothetical protein